MLLWHGKEQIYRQKTLNLNKFTFNHFYVSGETSVMHIYCAFIKPTLNALPFTYQVTVEKALPEDGGDERQFASEYKSNSEIWCMKDGTLAL